MAQFSLDLQPQRRIWTVAELTSFIRELLEGHLRDLWVAGEISNFREAQSGHYYFTLKDDRAQIRCVCFRNEARRLPFRPEDGLRVTVHGSVSVYDARGEYQLYVEHIEPVGLGALQLAFEQLKKRLEAEGLFDAARKKPLPMLPRRIGLVTSPAGAAVRDILRVLRRRFPGLHILVYPVRVQGEGAAEEIVEAIRFFNRKRLADVLIVARGGGSLEDLWAFNEEAVARAIAASLIPVVTGIGHETDFTIADFVADLRAPTPSAAAEMVVRTQEEFRRHIGELERRLLERTRYLLLTRRHRLQELRGHRAFRRLKDLLRQRSQHLDTLVSTLGERMRAHLAEHRRRLLHLQNRLSPLQLRLHVAHLRSRLEATGRRMIEQTRNRLAAAHQKLASVAIQLDERSPLRLLQRGYAVCYDERGALLRTIQQVSPGQEVQVQLADGRFAARAERILKAT
jgi:exodeoxyribonuclease VII large subunit